MPAFFYTAIDASGKQVSGNVIVRNKSEAYRELEARTLIPVVVGLEEEAAGGKRGGVKSGASGPKKLKRAELILFTEELADLLDAGMQLEKALKVLNERSTSASIKSVAGVLRDEIREGARFSKALSKASSTFDELYCSLVAAGETSGSLPEILRRLVVNLKQLSNLQRRTFSAMIYPLTVLLACVVLIFVVSTVLMPSMTKMMQKTGQDLPLVTDLLIRFTDFMTAWWWLILGLMIGSVVGFRLFISSSRGRPWWDEYKMKLPAFGPVIFGRFYAQFCHTMSNLINNGVPLLNSLKLITRGTQNYFIRNHLETVVLDVGEGSSLARAMSKTEAFPEGLIDRIAIGEQTGELGKAFSKAAAKYDEDLDIRISRLTSIVPNVMLCVVALVVGVVAYAVINTIFGSMSGIRGR